jgi:non-heme chloroperoxidase
MLDWRFRYCTWGEGVMTEEIEGLLDPFVAASSSEESWVCSRSGALAPRAKGAPVVMSGPGAREGAQSMAKDIVMLHGASAGGWCFDQFRGVFESLGWTCHTPDLIGHGKDAAAADTKLDGIGMADYRAELTKFLKMLSAPPVLLGHSMGAVLAQQLAASGFARALVLVSPAPRAGILPATDSERQLDQDLMTIGAFWKTVIHPDFKLACIYSLNRVPPEQQRSVFDRFGPESGRAYFELFFWMFDMTRATAVDTRAIQCPVLCLSGTDDNLVSLVTARATAAPYRNAPFWEEAGHGHMLPVEPGAETIASRIADWIPA